MPRKIRYKDKACMICGEMYTPAGSGSRYCDRCKAEAERQRREKKAAEKRAAKPEKALHTCDDMESINRCLQCTRPTCHGNCPSVKAAPGDKEPKYRAERMEREMAEFTRRALLGEGKQTIMAGMGLTDAQYRHRREQCRNAGLIPNNWEAARC